MTPAADNGNKVSKNWVITIMAGIIAFLATTGIYQHLKDNGAVASTVAAQQVELAELKTQLKTISETVVEIRADVKDLKK